MGWPPQSRTKTKTQQADTAGLMHTYLSKGFGDHVAEGVSKGAEISIPVIGQAGLKTEQCVQNAVISKLLTTCVQSKSV